MHNHKIRRDQLEKMMALFNFATHTRMMLRRALTKEMTYEEAGAPWGMSKQFVWKCVNMIVEQAELHDIETTKGKRNR